MKKITISVLLISIVGLIIYFINHHKVNGNELELYGNIEIRQVDLGFRVEGKIKEMLVEEGDAVKKGQLLAYLDSTTFSAAYEKSLAEIQLNKALNANANSKYERNIPLCSDSTTSKQDCEDLLNSKNTTSASLAASVASSKGAKKNLDDSSIYAPDDGIIMTRVQEPGAVVVPSQSVYTMAKIEPVWIRAYIPETNLGKITNYITLKFFILNIKIFKFII